MDKEMIYKSRSFLSCFNVAYKLIGDNFIRIIRRLWLPLLILAICNGILTLAQAYSLKSLTSDFNNPVITLLLYAISFVGLIIGSIWMTARLMALLNDFSVKKNIVSITFTFLNNIIIYIVLFVLAALCLYAAYRHSNVSLQVFLANNWLVIILIILFLEVIMLPFIYINMRYINKEGASFWKELPTSYATGFRHFGTLLVTALLLGMIFFIIYSIAGMPLFILHSARTTSLLGEMMGDPSDLPKNFTLLMVCTSVLTSLFVYIISVYPIIVCFFLYGSIEKQREENKGIIKLDNPISEEPELPLIKLE